MEIKQNKPLSFVPEFISENNLSLFETNTSQDGKQECPTGHAGRLHQLIPLEMEIILVAQARWDYTDWRGL